VLAALEHKKVVPPLPPLTKWGGGI
jgi:hypothetical protein